MTDAICFYFQERPRSFALRAGDYALVFLYSDDEELVPRCIVEFCPWQDVKEDKFRQLTPPPIYGCLGLINSGEDVFLCLITGCSKTAVIRKGETANKIFAVEFYCINNSKWDNSILGGYDVDQINLEANIEIETEQLCSSLQRLLTDGTFYFSADCDLTTKLQSREDLDDLIKN
ncbi:Inositol-1,4,5-trisphosphate 5-phosphatase 1 [Neolecta irregularis DAH-3]|uniref:Inositol-1,4,5-trisphosphate 5-phosphatase 1 n=1 Tax=Neolecta irregularis (strain DAH-3) TaxID=1198029 RepID=A0A1U7LM84_NEOID|nr:Inositol-1,4,5-trisphosphate 5-phosphatase 1 [Neolecta irregularis DAH-3]|eukprot:OLL23776.1 Inositol-1,4,5-trisphosphate 5-phosphatase 1 [Neolecta irregularis DAH-3]